MFATLLELVHNILLVWAARNIRTVSFCVLCLFLAKNIEQRPHIDCYIGQVFMNYKKTYSNVNVTNVTIRMESNGFIMSNLHWMWDIIWFISYVAIIVDKYLKKVTNQVQELWSPSVVGKKLAKLKVKTLRTPQLYRQTVIQRKSFLQQGSQNMKRNANIGRMIHIVRYPCYTTQC